jgi:GTPase
MTNQTSIHLAVFGAPNAGKSTLTNALVGQKVSIVSSKVQTTRVRVTGIAIEGTTQIVLVDTPGIFRPERVLEKAIVKQAWQSLDGVDAGLLVVDAKRSHQRGIEADIALIEGSKKRELPLYLALNKIDMLEKSALLALATRYLELAPFARIWMISALSHDDIADMKRDIATLSQTRPWAYDAESVSTMPMRLFAAELTREQLFHVMHQEVPYQLYVETEQWEETKKAVTVRQVIYVSDARYKTMLLGQKGERLKHIGIAVRKALAEQLGKPVHVFLFVKVQENWHNLKEPYHIMGFDGN